MLPHVTFRIALLCLIITQLSSAQHGWLTLSAFPGKEKLSFTTQHDSILFAGTVSGLWRSGNAGITWKQVLQGSPVTSLLASADGLVMAGGHHHVYFSYDRGNQWDSVALNNRQPVYRIISLPGREFMLITFGYSDSGYDGDGVYYSSGDMKKWIKRNAGLPSINPPTDNLLADRKGRVYVTVADEQTGSSGGLYYSDNKGLSWTKASLSARGTTGIRVEKSFGLSVTPYDSLIYSFTGAAVNIAVSLNLVKHIDDVPGTKEWRAMLLRPTTNWWYDLMLNNVYVAKDGSWYSSVSASASQGGVYRSGDQGKTWQRMNTGTALALSNNFEERIFRENAAGRIYMVQLLDERIYFTDRSLLNPVSITSKVIDDQGKALPGAQLKNSFVPFLSTNANGEFQLTLPGGWSGTITPSRTDYRFEPSVITIENIQQNMELPVIRATFTGKHGVWGFVKDAYGCPVSGISVKGFDEEIITNDNGSFAASVDHGWSGTVRVEGAGWKFEPAYVSVETVFGNVYALQFTGMPEGHVVIKGIVSDHTGAALPEAQLSGFPESVRINDEGQFITTVPVGWSGRIAVSHPEFFFTPDHIDISNISESLTGLTFRGQLFTDVEDEWIVFSAYPNPSANGRFSFRWPQQTADGKVVITSLGGQTIYASTLQNFQMTETWQAPVPGIYLLTITSGNKLLNLKLISL